MAALVAGLAQGSVYALFALSLALLFSVMRVVNFAHGDILTVALYLVATLVAVSGLTMLGAIPIVLASMALFGFILHRLLFSTTLRAPDPGLAQIFATVGLSIALQNGVQGIFGPNARRIPVTLSGSVQFGNAFLPAARLIPPAVLVVVVVALWYLFRRTQFGMTVRAVAEDRIAAQLVGIKVERTYGIVAALSFTAIAATALAIAPLFILDPGFGFSLILIAFMAVVIGGLGSIAGAVVGGLLLGLIEAFSAFYISPIGAPVAMYVVFLVVLVTRPHGLFGDPSWSLE